MALTAKKALAIANQYTDDTVIGGGAIKGKNCTIDSIEPISGGQRVTFKWTLDDGTEQTTTMDVMDGHDGQDGKSFEIKARFATYEELVEAFPHGPVNTGDAYFVGTTSNPDLYVWVTEDAEWTNNGPIAGVKGDKGDKGDTGADGFSPVASVTKSGNTVTISIRDKTGTTTEYVMDGADGDDGKSAYEVAVDEGFIGTEAEWVESLKGETGDGIYAVTVSQVQGASHLMVKYTSDTSTWVDCGAIASDVPIATTGVAGKVKPDGTTITVDNDGTIHGANTLSGGNGITIADGKVNADTNIFHGTRAQYEALSADDKKKYSHIGSPETVGGDFDVYSTTETKTNKVWIDGKPIYRKVINVGTLPSSADTKSVNHNISNLDKIINMTGFAYGSSVSLPLPHVDPVDYTGAINIYYNSTQVSIQVAQDRHYYDCYITIEYTKTTD